MRSLVCNPQLVAECNHFEEMYVIHRRWYVINPKEDTPGDAIHATRDYIRLTAITYQSFGLDKNKGTVETVPLFFGAANQNRTGDLILTKDVLYHLSHSSIFNLSANCIIN